MKSFKFALTVPLLFGGLFFPSNGAAQTTSVEENNKAGSICVLPNSPEPPTRISPGGEYNPDTLMVRLDKREPIRWPHKSRLLIDGLDLQDRHLVTLTSDGKGSSPFGSNSPKTMMLGSAFISTAIKGCSWEIGPTPIGAESRIGIAGDKSWLHSFSRVISTHFNRETGIE